MSTAQRKGTSGSSRQAAQPDQIEPDQEQQGPDPEDIQFWNFIASLMVSSGGQYNIPDILIGIKGSLDVLNGSLDQIKQSIDVNSKCQLKLANLLEEKKANE